MKILSIESSCDETAAAVIENGRKIISSVVATQVEEHKLYGGVVPEIASRRHCEAINGVIRETLEQAVHILRDSAKLNENRIKNIKYGMKRAKSSLSKEKIKAPFLRELF